MLFVFVFVCVYYSVVFPLRDFFSFLFFHHSINRHLGRFIQLAWILFIFSSQYYFTVERYQLAKMDAYLLYEMDFFRLSFHHFIIVDSYISIRFREIKNICSNKVASNFKLYKVMFSREFHNERQSFGCLIQ